MERSLTPWYGHIGTTKEGQKKKILLIYQSTLINDVFSLQAAVVYGSKFRTKNLILPVSWTFIKFLDPFVDNNMLAIIAKVKELLR